MIFNIIRSNAAFLCLFLFPLPAFAGEFMLELGQTAVLGRPSSRPRGPIILMAGGDGQLGISAGGFITRLTGNSLIRTRRQFVAAGYATLALSSEGSPSAAVAAMRRVAQPVIVVGTSRAATRMHGAVSADALVVTAGMLDHLQRNIGFAGSLPPTPIVHHRRDGCRLTLPELVPAFAAWGGPRVRVAWIDGGRDEGDPCQARGHHGFAGVEGRMVGAITSFSRSVNTRRWPTVRSDPDLKPV